MFHGGQRTAAALVANRRSREFLEERRASRREARVSARTQTNSSDSPEMRPSRLQLDDQYAFTAAQDVGGHSAGDLGSEVHGDRARRYMNPARRSQQQHIGVTPVRQPSRHGLGSLKQHASSRRNVVTGAFDKDGQGASAIGNAAAGTSSESRPRTAFQQLEDLNLCGALQDWMSMIFCRRKPINAANEDDEAGRARRVSTVTMLRKRAEIDAVFLGWYESPHVQKIIGGIILFNFVINALQATAWVRESDSAQIGFDVVSKVILSLFTVELMVSMFCHGWKNFWKDWWNRFDLFIIVFGWPIEFVNANSEYSWVSSLRVIRTLRLIKMIKPLKSIVQSLVVAIPAVGWIIFLLLTIISSYAIVGVALYRDDQPEFFGNLSRAMFTLFQVMTLENWAGGIARPIMDSNKFAYVFFISYILITVFMMMNLFTATLLDAVGQVKMTEQDENEQRLILEDDLLDEQLQAANQGDLPVDGALEADSAAAHEQVLDLNPKETVDQAGTHVKENGNVFSATGAAEKGSLAAASLSHTASPVEQPTVLRINSVGMSSSLVDASNQQLALSVSQMQAKLDRMEQLLTRMMLVQSQPAAQLHSQLASADVLAPLPGQPF